ncbi:hypothetical protein MTMN5_03563 [Marinobacter salarius]|nr:hypothetical protein MTMN5_03563 [Marinobacter salarius]
MQTPTESKTAEFDDIALTQQITPADYSVVMPKLWNQKTLAAYLGKSTAWCERARWAGEGPRFIKLGRHVRYRADDVLGWIEDNVRTSSNSRG